MSGDTFDIVQGNRDTITGTLHDPAATTGDVLTVQADKSIAAQPGGGSMPVQAVYGGNPVTIANNDGAPLTFDTLVSGTELFDRTDPANPVFLAAGLYVVVAVVTCPALTANGSYSAQIVFAADVSGYAAGETPFAPVGLTLAGISASVGAGDTLQLSVVNKDGVSSRDFTLEAATIVKLA